MYYSVSRIQSFISCNRKYYYNYLAKIQVPANIYLRRGSALHELLEMINNMYEQNNINIIRDKLPNQIKKKIEKYNLGKEYELTFQMYIDQYLKILPSLGTIVGVEFPFDFKIHLVNYEVRFKGVFDLITLNNGNISVYDFKTKKKSFNMTKELETDLQMQLYCYVLYNYFSVENNMLVRRANTYTPIEKYGHVQFSNYDQSMSIWTNSIFTTQSTLKTIEDTINKIQFAVNTCHFPTNRSRLCDYCDFKEYCSG